MPCGYDIFKCDPYGRIVISYLREASAFSFHRVRRSHMPRIVGRVAIQTLTLFFVYTNQPESEESIRVMVLL